MAVEFVLSVLVVGAIGCASAVAFWLGFNRGHAQGWEGGRRAAETQAKLRYNSKPRVDADHPWT